MAKEKFNLTSLLNNQSIITEDKEQLEDEFDIRLIDVYKLEPSQENFYNVSEIEEMKQSIELLGIEQNLIVKQNENGKYKVLAGHRRRLASMKLVEEGKEKYRFVPCRVKNKTNEILDKLTIIMTNSTQRELSDYEKIQQVLKIETLVMELKREIGIKGRTRELLSEITNVSATQIGRYKATVNNLCKDLMEAFKECKIGFSVAYEASTLSETRQNMLLKLLEHQVITLADVKEMKREEENNKQIPGQIDLLNKNDDSYLECKTLEKSKESVIEEEEIKEDDKSNLKEIKETKEIVEEIAENEKEEEIKDDTEEKQNEGIRDIKEEHKVGCSFCRGENAKGLMTSNGNFSIFVEKVKHRPMIISNTIGEVDETMWLYCPICGKRL